MTTWSELFCLIYSITLRLTNLSFSSSFSSSPSTFSLFERQRQPLLPTGSTQAEGGAFMQNTIKQEVAAEVAIDWDIIHKGVVWEQNWTTNIIASLGAMILEFHSDGGQC
ncbi:hypothetical protein Dimus_021272 [Dionaea muscipula]